MSDIRVYLVEDQALLRESFRATLELEPDIDIVGEAADAEKAVMELETLHVDVVLMDIRLPGMDGIEATRLLKEKHRDLAVVVLTSYQDEYLGAAFEAGASGYVLKSSTRHQLVEAVRAACQGRVFIDPSLTGKLAGEVAELRKVHRESLLTPRQVEILKLVASGIKYKDIATRLILSKTTVNREMRNIYNRLGVNEAPHAISEAYKKGIL